MRTLLREMKGFIEDTQSIIDAEWGSCRDVEEIIDNGDMPELYNKVLHELSKLD